MIKLKRYAPVKGMYECVEGGDYVKLEDVKDILNAVEVAMKTSWLAGDFIVFSDEGFAGLEKVLSDFLKA